MNLGDAFTRRKQIDNEIVTWTNRLKLAGRTNIVYQTRDIEGPKSFQVIPGTRKEFIRNYTIPECQAKITALIEEDKALARKISLTNQIAKAKIIDLDGTEKILTIPELLVLRNEIGPKLEAAAQAIPKLPTGVEILEKTKEFVKWREVEPHIKNIQEMSDRNLKIEKDIVEYYSITEVTDYGIPERQVFDEVDKIHNWMERIKNAINDANKTNLIE